MSDSPNQLEEIDRQLRDHFASHPLISVNPTKGNPPEQYEVIYTISGISKTSEEEITESIDHIIEIAIPFGFPHFPPSCKPKSDIYHPDFDPAAICLGDFWEQDRSISELIIHIGKMINGELYSTTNAFNEEAADWYQKHAEKFPLKQVKWEIGGELKNSSSDLSSEIDTLDDTDLTTEFDFLSLESGGDDEDIILNTAFPEVDSSSDLDLELFNQLKRQKKYYTLLRTGEEQSGSSTELTQLCQHAKTKIKEAEKLHREAKKFESKGSARIALEKYQQLTTLVSDFPVIDADIQRVKQTLALLEEINSEESTDIFKPEESSEAIISDDSSPEPVKTKNKKSTRKEQTVKPHPVDQFSAPKRSGLKLYLVLALLTITIGLGGYFWYSFSNKLGKAEDAYAECSTSYANNQFNAAKLSCDKALQLVSEVKFIHQDFAKQLKKFILEILQSEKLVQGLAGNELFDGRYIPKAEAAKLLAIQEKLNEADALFSEKKWEQALELYKTLLAQVESNKYFSPSIIEDKEHKSLMTEFRMFYDPAQVSMQNGKWQEAIEQLLQAQKILVSLPEADREKYSEQLQKDLLKSQFANLKEQGDQSFTSDDWLSAIASYNLALTRGQQAALSPESIDAIRNNIKRAELYTTIYEGNTAFASGAWDKAISAYSKATSLLINSHRIPYEKDSDVNVRKLERIILQASIIRDQQATQALIENDELDKAIVSYRQLLESIEKSTFGTEQTFIETSEEVKKAIGSLEQEILLNKQIQYLHDNYQSLFIANYPSAVPEKLTNPVISKTKVVGTKTVFRMQCTETGGSRPLTLVMHYAYDSKTNQWNLYSE